MPTTKHVENTQNTVMGGKKTTWRKWRSLRLLTLPLVNQCRQAVSQGILPEASPSLANVINHHIGMWPTDKSRGLASFWLWNLSPGLLPSISMVDESPNLQSFWTFGRSNSLSHEPLCYLLTKRPHNRNLRKKRALGSRTERTIGEVWGGWSHTSTVRKQDLVNLGADLW